MRKLTIVFHDAGGGHRSTANALASVLSGSRGQWAVRMLDLQEMLDPLDVSRRLTGIRIQDIYNQILRHGWTRLTPQLLVVLQGVILLHRRSIVRTLKEHWAKYPSDLVLSVIPHFNRALSESLSAQTRTPFVTLITDLADYPPHFWIEPESEYIIAGTFRARQQALEMGHPSSRVFLTSGMVLKPNFYHRTVIDVPTERAKLGLAPDCPTGLILFGGHGSEAMVDIVKDLDRIDARLQFILLCGHNRELASRLRGLHTTRRCFVQEFTPEVQSFMGLADFFIGKPGPGSISEALQMGLPVIVECNSRTLPQERYNAQWVAENDFGSVLTSFQHIGGCVQELLRPERFAQLRRNVSTYSNHALEEVPQILEGCWNAKWELPNREIPAESQALQLMHA